MSRSHIRRVSYQFTHPNWRALMKSSSVTSMLVERIGQLGQSHGIRGIAFDLEDGLTVTSNSEWGREQRDVLEGLLALCAETLPYAERELSDQRVRDNMALALAAAMAPKAPSYTDPGRSVPSYAHPFDVNGYPRKI